MSHITLGLLTAAIATLPSLGCSPRDIESGDRTDAPAAPSLSPLVAVFTSADTVVLRTPATAPIIRVSGVSVAPSGRIALADVSEGNVKVFEPTGTLAFIVGGKGMGPGEFQQPRFPRFDRRGDLHVADGANARISVFSDSGRLIGDIPLDGGLMPVSGFAVVGDSLYVLTSAGSSADVLHLLKRDGTPVGTFLHRDAMRAEDQPDNPLWRTASQFWLGVRRDTAFVVHTLNDSLWTVDLRTGRVSSVGLTLPGYLAPRIPEAPPADIKALMAWTRSYHVAASISVTDHAVVVPFVKGVLNYGDPSVAAVFQDGAWRAVADPPPVIAGSPSAVVALLDPASEATDTLALGFLRVTP